MLRGLGSLRRNVWRQSAPAAQQQTHMQTAHGTQAFHSRQCSSAVSTPAATLTCLPAWPPSCTRAGAFYLGYGVAHVPSTCVTMQLGARWWFGTMTIAWGIVATSAAAITNRTGLVLQRLLLGITEAGGRQTQQQQTTARTQPCNELDAVPAEGSGGVGCVLGLVGKPGLPRCVPVSARCCLVHCDCCWLACLCAAAGCYPTAFHLLLQFYPKHM